MSVTKTIRLDRNEEASDLRLGAVFPPDSGTWVISTQAIGTLGEEGFPQRTPGSRRIMLGTFKKISKTNILCQREI